MEALAGQAKGGFRVAFRAAPSSRQRECTGISLFEVVPYLANRIDRHGVLAAIGPRPIFVVSGTEDKYSRDTDQVVAKIAGNFITELRVERGFALDQERFDAIVEWIIGRVSERT